MDAIIGDLACENLREDLAHVLHTRVAKTKQVKIAGCPVWLARPKGEQRGALEHELFCVSRGRGGTTGARSHTA